MGWWKADPEPALQSPARVSPAPAKPLNHPPIDPSASADKCPVDEKTREIWLQAAKAQRDKGTQTSPLPAQIPKTTTAKQTTSPTNARLPAITSSPPAPTPLASQECSSDTISQVIRPRDEPTIMPPGSRRPLSHDREISTIPRAQAGTSDSASPSNNEVETGVSTSGNWIYPSETQFFNAVMRKSTTTTSAQDLASSVSSIIPIHNAVNERAWAQIKKWEGSTSARCGGPKLMSFKGLGAGAISPKAKWNHYVNGALEPFDRHDWVVERCGGETVEYVIDFYQGKQDPNIRDTGGNINFYLDVRPKLNSVEGCRMRLNKWMGWS